MGRPTGQRSKLFKRTDLQMKKIENREGDARIPERGTTQNFKIAISL